MALESIVNIDVDFYDKKYILINAKRLDRSSRFFSITCYNQGNVVSIDGYTAYIRYKKADGYAVFNFCKIDKNKIVVELTEQMLASDGICVADLVIVENGQAEVDVNTGEIININNTSILSTMPIYIDVIDVAANNSNIESTYEVNMLNETLQKYEADYQDVVKTAKSWAVGGTGSRNDEDTNNAKYYAELALENAFGGDSIVAKIKGSNESNFRSGEVIISAENVGAVSTENIANVNEVKGFLGI